MVYCSGVSSAWANFFVRGLSRVGTSVSYAVVFVHSVFSGTVLCGRVVAHYPLLLVMFPLSVLVTFVMLDCYCGALVIMRSVLSPRWDVPVFLYYPF